ncbi:MAG: hypothetical protein COA58_07115 [Bacteroidetes bacterium]|nr:MAG: hypothetical protein COA58_07115 [Bacteroidota bacterium]
MKKNIYVVLLLCFTTCLYAQKRVVFTEVGNHDHHIFNDTRIACQGTDSGHVMVGAASYNANFDESAAIIIRTDASNNIKWQYQVSTEIPGTKAYFTKVIQSNNGDIFAIGQINEDPSNPGSTQGLILRVSCTGVVSLSIKEENACTFNDVVADTTNNDLYICGSYMHPDPTIGIKPMIYTITQSGGSPQFNTEWPNGAEMAEFTTLDLYQGFLFIFGYEIRNGRKDVLYCNYFDKNSGFTIASTPMLTYNFGSAYFNLFGDQLNDLVPNELYINQTNGEFLLCGDVFDDFDPSNITMNTSFVAAGRAIQLGGGITEFWEYHTPFTNYENKTSIIPKNISIQQPKFYIVQSNGNLHYTQQSTTSVSSDVNTVISHVTNWNNITLSRELVNDGVQWIFASDEGLSSTTTGTGLLGAGMTIISSTPSSAKRDAYKIFNDPILNLKPAPCKIIDGKVEATHPDPTIFDPEPSTLEYTSIPEPIELDDENLMVFDICDNDTPSLPCEDPNITMIDSGTILVGTGPLNTLFLTGKYYLQGIVTVAPGTILDITNVDMLFAPCSELIVNGRIRANNSVFRPCIDTLTWKGIRFTSTSKDNKINECTFKNAEVALYFQSSNNPIINSNTFINNKWSIYSDFTTFSNPIAGNNFTHNAEYPNLVFCNVLSTPNIGSIYFNNNSNVTSEIFNNAFNNNGLTMDNYFGIICTYSRMSTVSENTFSDIARSIFLTNGTSSPIPMRINNNSFERQHTGVIVPQVVVQLTNTPVEIENNTIRSNVENTISGAVDIALCSGVNVHRNTIEGFWYGIVFNRTNNCSANENTIENQDVVGIISWFSNNNSIRCNKIDVNHKNVGIYNIGSTGNTIESNCISNSTFSILLAGPCQNTNILNNYLYNYTQAGVFNAGEPILNIGNNSVMGQNTFVGHNNTFDVFTAIGLTTFCFDNYDLTNINFPNTQIGGPKSVYSTSSCGHQIYNLPNNPQPLVYRCDEIIQFDALTIEELLEYVSSTEGFADEENTVYQELRLKDIDKAIEFRHQLFQSSRMNPNEKKWFRAREFEHNGDLKSAIAELKKFVAIDPIEQANKIIYMNNLATKRDGQLSNISMEDLNFIQSVYNSDSLSHNNLGLLLMEHGRDAKINYSIIDYVEPKVNGKIHKLNLESDFVSIYPNPVESKLTLIYSFNKDSEGVTIEITDMLGRIQMESSSEIFEGTAKINVSDLSPGSYFVSIKDGDVSLIEKFVKK